MKDMKSGSRGDGQKGPTKRAVSAQAGAGNVRGGATKKSSVKGGPRDQKSGCRGG